MDNKKGWVLKNWCLQTVVLGRTLESPLDCKEIKWVNAKGNQPWISTGRTDAEAEASKFGPPDVKCQLTGLDPDAGKDWRQEEKRMIKDEIVGWHHRLNVHEFEQTPGHGEGQESLVCCSSWGCKSQTRLNYWTHTHMSLTQNCVCVYVYTHTHIHIHIHISYSLSIHLLIDT